MVSRTTDESVGYSRTSLKIWRGRMAPSDLLLSADKHVSEIFLNVFVYVSMDSRLHGNNIRGFGEHYVIPAQAGIHAGMMYFFHLLSNSLWSCSSHSSPSCACCKRFSRVLLSGVCFRASLSNSTASAWRPCLVKPGPKYSSQVQDLDQGRVSEIFEHGQYRCQYRYPDQ